MSALNLDQRWEEIRKTRVLADFQDALLSSHGVQSEVVPQLVGRRSVFFLAPSDRWPFAVPVGLLEPADPATAQETLGHISDLACLRDGALLWVGPAEAKELLARLSKDDGPKFPDVVPLDEIADRLPPGGLVRGCLNAPAAVRLLRESALDACPFPFRNAAAALTADLAAVRYVAFRRDFVDGQFTTDGFVAYDPTRLPPEVSQLLNPAASPVLIPASGSNLFEAGRLQSRPSWSPPSVRNRTPGCPGFDTSPPVTLGVRSAISLSGWTSFSSATPETWIAICSRSSATKPGCSLPAINGTESVEIVLVFELRGGKAIEGVLEDLFSWAGEQVWLDSFGILSTRPWREDQPGVAIRGLTLRTPLASLKGPAFEVAGRYLVVALQPSGLDTGRAWVSSIEAAKKTNATQTTGSHGTILVEPSEIAHLLRVVDPTARADNDQRLWDAVLGLMADAGTLRVDLKYERDGVRFHGQLPIGRSE